MPTEQREGVTRVEIDGSTGDRRSLQSRWKAAAFGGWHEPYEARVSCTVL